MRSSTCSSSSVRSLSSRLCHLPALPLVLVGSLAFGCATTTQIVSDPPGATVTLEGDKGEKKQLGKTPLKHETSMWIFSSERLRVRSGSQEKLIELKRTELDLVPTIGAVCLTATVCGSVAGIPLFLAGGMKLPDEVKVDLRSRESSASLRQVLSDDPDQAGATPATFPY